MNRIKKPFEKPLGARPQRNDTLRTSLEEALLELPISNRVILALHLGADMGLAAIAGELELAPRVAKGRLDAGLRCIRTLAWRAGRPLKVEELKELLREIILTGKPAPTGLAERVLKYVFSHTDLNPALRAAIDRKRIHGNPQTPPKEPTFSRISQRRPSAVHSEAAAGVSTNAVSVRLASTLEEYADAFRIAYQVYFPLGYIDYAPGGMRMTPYQFRKDTVVFVAYHEGRAIASLSLFEDGEEGLPSDNGWREDLDGLRTTRKKIFEVGSLMVLPNCPLQGPGICLALFRQAWMYARRFRGADTLCAFVQKRHAFFYTKMMCFTSFGPIRDYQWNGLAIPSVSALAMTLDGAESEFKNRYNHFGDSPKNLFRYFVIDGREETETQLKQALCRRARMNFCAMRKQFDRLNLVPSAPSAQTFPNRLRPFDNLELKG